MYVDDALAWVDFYHRRALQERKGSCWFLSEKYVCYVYIYHVGTHVFLCSYEILVFVVWS